VKVRVARMPMTVFWKTRTLGEMEWFVKALVGRVNQILGFTALGNGAGELLLVV
jgi:pyruvate/2-oxoglutarate dehydrogenase complex dihydrolipoamide dehydrogenase (E3) component